MRRRRTKSVQPGVSLFPFLAVLICTLGVLIVLLVLAVQSATLRKADQRDEVAARKAEQDAELQAAALAKKEEQQKVLEKLEDEIDRHILEAEGFEDSRPEVRREVVRAREYKAHLEKEIRDLEEQAKQLAAEITLLDSDADKVVPVDSSELELLRKKIELAQSELDDKRSNIRVIEQKKYTIVPYHGAGGTKRIPVFVECRAEGLVLRPWGIKLTWDDFFHPVAAGNPVDAALATIRNYYQKHELTEKDQRPYPLLVVRPDGAQSYGLARRSLVSWDDEFGYELVSNDLEIDFGTIDPQLESEIRKSVEQAKQTQLALKRRRAVIGRSRQAAANQSGVSGNGFSGGLRSSTRHGGFVREGGGNEMSAPNQQAGFEANKSRGEDSKISSTFQTGTGDSANAGFASESEQSSAGPNALGSTRPNENLANARGVNWALPTQTSGATGYVRPVSVVCGTDSLTIKNAAGNAVTIPWSANHVEAIDQMVNIVWQRIDSWGIAGQNAYWKPNLAVKVQPGASERFAILKKMLKDSGLGIEEVSQ